MWPYIVRRAIILIFVPIRTALSYSLVLLQAYIPFREILEFYGGRKHPTTNFPLSF